MNDEQKAAEAEFILRTNQLRNFRQVLGSSMPKKRYEHLSSKILPGYLTRRLNAMNKYLAVRKTAEQETKDDTLTNVTKEKS